MKNLPLLIISLLMIVMLASCEFDVATETTVYPDGSLEKAVQLGKTDSTNLIFNVKTWEKFQVKKEKHEKIEKHDTMSNERTTIDSVRYITLNRFQKKFASADEANADLSVTNDTTLQVTSKFEKRFRWFYTYITYSETYHKLNKLRLSSADYLTPEDYAFIDRLPAEGEKISKADELYLTSLRSKIFDDYGDKAFYDEFFDLATIVVTTPDGQSLLEKHKSDFRNALEKISNRKDVDENNMLLITMDSFNIPIDRSKVAEFQIRQKALWKKVSFISNTSDGKFVNRINLPWDVVKTNADSVSGNSLFWAPPTIKFLLNDYTMYGECRKLNWWAVLVSLMIVGFTGYLFVRKSA